MKNKTIKEVTDNFLKDMDKMFLKHKIDMDLINAKSENFELEMWKKGLRYEIQ